MTTVGYGDVVPQDTVGKVIAVFLMLGGLSLLRRRGQGAITSSFVSQTEAERRKGGDDPVMQTLQDMRQMHQDMSAQLEQMQDRAFQQAVIRQLDGLVIRAGRLPKSGTHQSCLLPG